MVKPVNKAVLFCLMVALLMVASAVRGSGQYGLDAFPGSIAFEHLGAEDGLSQAAIYAIAQDDIGYLWFATGDGLNRFDGHEVQVYRHSDADDASLGNSYVNALFVDAAGDLWVGSRGGLQRFDFAQQTFSYIGASTDIPATLDTMVVSVIAEDQKGNLWVGSDRGRLIRINPSRDSAQTLIAPMAVPTQGQPSTINHLWLREDGTAIISADNGIFRLLADTNQYDLRHLQIPNPRQAIRVVAKVGDEVWAGGDKGIMVWPGLNALLTNQPPLRTELSRKHIKNIWLKDKGLVWIASREGLYARDPADPNATWIPHRHDERNQFSLSSDDVRVVFEDRTGVMWFGTEGGGVSKFSPSQASFRHVGSSDVAGAGLAVPQVWAVKRTRDGDLWVGTKGGGLQRYDHVEGRFYYYRHDPDRPGSLPANWILSILQDAKDRIWIGTRDGGLALYQPETQTFKSWQFAPGDQSSLPDNRVYAMVEGNANDLWLATNHGLSRFFPETQQFVNFRAQPESGALPENNLRTLTMDSQGRLWVGTRRSGVSVLDVDSMIFTQPINEMDGFMVLRILQQEDGLYWLATDHGLGRYDETKREIQFLRKGDGLPNDLVYTVLSDSDGKLWVPTNEGLARNNPETGEIRIYDHSSGLISNEFNQGAYFQDDSGIIMLGTVRGVSAFDPTELVWDLTEPQGTITDYRVLNKSVSLARLQDATSEIPGLPQHISTLDTINVVPEASVLTFDFSALHFASPERNIFRYRLLGLSDEWIETDARRRSATFTGLAPGEYVLELVARSGEGVWQKQPRRVVLNVLPPWWRTSFAFVVYLLVLMGLAALWYRARATKLQEREMAQRAIAESEERLRLALWGSGDELWDWDMATGAVHRMNVLENADRPEFEPLNRLEDVGKAVHPEDQEMFKKALQDHLNDASPSYHATYRILDRQGNWTWVLERGKVVATDDEGRPLRISGTTKNVDELKAAEAALRALNDELEERVADRTQALQSAYENLQNTQQQLVESEKMASLGGLVAGVAHELNTPIGIGLTAASHLQGKVRKLLDAGNPAEKELRRLDESAGLILTSLERAAKMVRSFKQVAVDQVIEEKRQFDLRQYLDQILTSLHPRLRKTKVQVALHIEEGVMLESYPGVLYQIVSNLVLNSLIHGYSADESGTITISAQPLGSNALEFNYADDGAGMPASVSERIFEPFFTTKRTTGGTGLGMHIVYNLVTQMLGGTIECKSAPGEGVQFSMRLPNVLAASQAAVNQS